ncbi:hypothetical protein ACFWPU_07485 [Streptomyces sp. NPDC058471]|uniref:hypothetical protein n=1 Tax=Streptomyces sp. NPDC058471 TaxID=3346516 RepID=UPI00364C6D3E
MTKRINGESPAGPPLRQPFGEEAGLDGEVALVQFVELRADGPRGSGLDRFGEEGSAIPGTVSGLAAVDELLKLHRRPIGLGHGVLLQDVLGDVEANV